jgi:hypothetical protein
VGFHPSQSFEAKNNLNNFIAELIKIRNNAPIVGMTPMVKYRKTKIQMNTIIETFTSVPLEVTLQHSLEAIKIFGPLALVMIATFVLIKTK